MSHGRRMLDAQAKRDGVAGSTGRVRRAVEEEEEMTAGSGRLRSERAFNDDGTPIRAPRPSVASSLRSPAEAATDSPSEPPLRPSTAPDAAHLRVSGSVSPIAKALQRRGDDGSAATTTPSVKTRKEASSTPGLTASGSKRERPRRGPGKKSEDEERSTERQTARAVLRSSSTGTVVSPFSTRMRMEPQQEEVVNVDDEEETTSPTTKAEEPVHGVRGGEDSAAPAVVLRAVEPVPNPPFPHDEDDTNSDQSGDRDTPRRATLSPPLYSLREAVSKILTPASSPTTRGSPPLSHVKPTGHPPLHIQPAEGSATKRESEGGDDHHTPPSPAREVEVLTLPRSRRRKGRRAPARVADPASPTDASTPSRGFPSSPSQSVSLSAAGTAISTPDRRADGGGPAFYPAHRITLSPSHLSPSKPPSLSPPPPQVSLPANTRAPPPRDVPRHNEEEEWEDEDEGDDEKGSVEDDARGSSASPGTVTAPTASSRQPWKGSAGRGRPLRPGMPLGGEAAQTTPAVALGAAVSSAVRTPPTLTPPTAGQSPPSLRDAGGVSASYGGSGSLLPLVSPPLRAVVSPRTLPQHPTRVDSAGSLSSRAGGFRDSRRSTPTTLGNSQPVVPQFLSQPAVWREEHTPPMASPPPMFSLLLPSPESLSGQNSVSFPPTRVDEAGASTEEADPTGAGRRPSSAAAAASSSREAPSRQSSAATPPLVRTTRGGGGGGGEVVVGHVTEHGMKHAAECAATAANPPREKSEASAFFSSSRSGSTSATERASSSSSSRHSSPTRLASTIAGIHQNDEEAVGRPPSFSAVPPAPPATATWREESPTPAAPAPIAFVEPLPSPYAVQTSGGGTTAGAPAQQCITAPLALNVDAEPSFPRSPQSPQSPSQMEDYSGFRNEGNDCYACSVLTFLLRSPVFRKALLTSPLIRANNAFLGMHTQALFFGSGYTIGGPQRRPTKARRTHFSSQRNEGSTAAVAVARAKVEATAEEPPAGCGQGPPPLRAVSSTATTTSATTSPSSSSSSSSGSSFSTEEDSDSAASSSSGYDTPHSVMLPSSSPSTPVSPSALVEVDRVSGKLRSTVHSVLADVIHAQQRRERFITILRNPTIPETRRHLLMRDYLARFVDPTTHVNQFRYGIDLGSFADFFDDEFFLGEQEDAHELFVALITKLESEADTLEKRRAAARAQIREEAEAPPRTGMAAMDAEVSTNTNGGYGASENKAEEVSSTTSGNPTKPVWINALMQGKLLNVIRCRNPSCNHEIASVEPYINLSLALHVAAPASGTTLSTPAKTGSEDKARSSVGTSPVKSPTKPPRHVPTVTELLRRSMAYEKLDDYVCDVCRSSQQQYQCGCFFGTPPSLLVMQLKRFALRREGGIVLVTKDRTAVEIEEFVEVYSLPDNTTHPTRGTKEETKTHNTGDGLSIPEDATTTRRRRTPAKTWNNEEEEDEGATALQKKQCYFDTDAKCLTSLVQKAERAAALKCSASNVGKAATGASRSGGGGGAVFHRHGEESEGETTRATAEDDTIDAIRSTYRLQSTVLHFGETLHYGHYVAEFAVRRDGGRVLKRLPKGTAASSKRRVAKHKKQGEEEEKREEEQAARGHRSQRRRVRTEWKLANDARVTTESPTNVAERRMHCGRSYLLLYEKVREERVRCPVWLVLPRPDGPEKEGGEAGDDSVTC